MTWTGCQRGRSRLTGRSGSDAAGYGPDFGILHAKFGPVSASPTTCGPQADTRQSSPAAAFLQLTFERTRLDQCLAEIPQSVRIRDRVVQIKPWKRSQVIRSHAIAFVASSGGPQRLCGASILNFRTAFSGILKNSVGKAQNPPSRPYAPTGRPSGQYRSRCLSRSQKPSFFNIPTFDSSNRCESFPQTKSIGFSKAPIVLGNNNPLCSAVPSQDPSILESVHANFGLHNVKAFCADCRIARSANASLTSILILSAREIVRPKHANSAEITICAIRRASQRIL